jgi:hypothetical protein
MTLDELRAAYEAAQEALDTSAQREALDAARKALADAIYEAAVAEMDDTYELVYVDYRDRLSEKQVAALVQGDMDTVWDLTAEWESDSQWSGAEYVVENNLGIDKEDLEILKDAGRYSDLIDQVRERDASPWLDELMGNTSAPLLRISCIDEDSSFSFQPVEPEQVLEAVGFEPTEHNVRVVRECLLECSPEFSVLMGYWLCTIDLKILSECPDDGQIRIKNPVLYLGNPFAGSGYFSDPLHGEVVIPRSEIRTDKDAFGYSVDEVFGGLNASSFEVEAEIVQ